MWQASKIIQSSAQFPHLPPTSLPLTKSHDMPKQTTQFSRRELAFATSSSLILLAPQTLDPFFSKALAEENEVISNSTCIDENPTRKAFLDISIDGQPIGRVVIGLHNGIAPVGASQFGSLVSGARGVTYRKKEFIKIMPNYVQHGGLRSYGVDAEIAKRTGARLEIDDLKAEWEKINGNCAGTKNVKGSVGIIVRDPLKPPPKIKLVARKGKLEIDEEEIGKEPNGTEFVISMKDSPELDGSVLVVGKVLEGMEVIEKVGQVKTVNDNTASPYFRVAKLVGDKRAMVAERGFNRPYAKVIVSNCGLLE